MPQIVLIHGGNSFNSYQSYLDNLKTSPLDMARMMPFSYWKHALPSQFSEGTVLLPSFPNSDNAHYEEWEIYFEKLLPMLNDELILIGHSLGAMFLTIYLQNHTLKQPLKKLILLAGGYDDETNEELGSFKVSSAKNLTKSTREVHLFHSTDDPVVPFSELAKYQADLPDAIVHTFSDRQHFHQPAFPELIEILKQ